MPGVGGEGELLSDVNAPRPVELFVAYQFAEQRRSKTNAPSASSERYVIGVDVDIGSARTGLFNLRGQGRLLASAKQPISLHRAGSRVEQSTEIWHGAAQSVRSAVSDAGMSPDAVAGTGFNPTCSLVVIGETQSPAVSEPLSMQQCCAASARCHRRSSNYIFANFPRMPLSARCTSIRGLKTGVTATALVVLYEGQIHQKAAVSARIKMKIKAVICQGFIRRHVKDSRANLGSVLRSDMSTSSLQEVNGRAVPMFRNAGCSPG